MNKLREKTLVGRTSTADFPAEAIRGVPAKIDTGADSSSIWASDIKIGDDKKLRFKLFAPGSKHYTGKTHVRKIYRPIVVRVASGHAQVRYKVKLSIVVGGRRVKGTFTLSDRSKNTYPILIGCSLLNKKFIVDVSLNKPPRKHHSHDIYGEFKSDPKTFYEKYHQDNERGDVEL